MCTRAAVSVFGDRKNNADHVKKKEREKEHYDGLLEASLSLTQIGRFGDGTLSLK